MEEIALYQNDGLKALSFWNALKNENIVYDEKKLKKYGSLSNWSSFLEQFPNLSNNNNYC